MKKIILISVFIFGLLITFLFLPANKVIAACGEYGSCNSGDWYKCAYDGTKRLECKDGCWKVKQTCNPGSYCVHNPQENTDFCRSNWKSFRTLASNLVPLVDFTCAANNKVNVKFQWKPGSPALTEFLIIADYNPWNQVKCPTCQYSKFEVKPSGVSNSTYTVQNLKRNTTYYWRVATVYSDYAIPVDSYYPSFNTRQLCPAEGGGNSGPEPANQPNQPNTCTGIGGFTCKSADTGLCPVGKVQRPDKSCGNPDLICCGPASRGSSSQPVVPGDSEPGGSGSGGEVGCTEGQSCGACTSQNPSYPIYCPRNPAQGVQLLGDCWRGLCSDGQCPAGFVSNGDGTGYGVCSPASAPGPGGRSSPPTGTVAAGSQAAGADFNAQVGVRKSYVGKFLDADGNLKSAGIYAGPENTNNFTQIGSKDFPQNIQRGFPPYGESFFANWACPAPGDYYITVTAQDTSLKNCTGNPFEQGNLPAGYAGCGTGSSLIVHRTNAPTVAPPVPASQINVTLEARKEGATAWSSSPLSGNPPLRVELRAKVTGGSGDIRYKFHCNKASGVAVRDVTVSEDSYIFDASKGGPCYYRTAQTKTASVTVTRNGTQKPPVDLTINATAQSSNNCSNVQCTGGTICNPNTGACENPSPGTYSISGNVFVDTNGNRIKDSGEANYPGATLKLRTGSCTGNLVQGPVTSNSSGGSNYTFSGLDNRQYYVVFTKPSGYDITVPTATLCSGQDYYLIRTLSGASVTQNWGIRQSGSQTQPPPASAPSTGGSTITGTLFIDNNSNGTKDTGEEGYNSIGQNSIYIQVTTGTGNFITTWQPTDGSGTFSFNNLVGGTYKVGIKLPQGYIYTTPGSKIITVPLGKSVSFGIKWY